MITNNCEFTALIRDIKKSANDLEPGEKGVYGVIFLARLLKLAEMVSEAAKMVKVEPALAHICWEIENFYKGQKEGEEHEAA